MDLAIGDSASSSVYGLLGKGDGTFEAPVVTPGFIGGMVGCGTEFETGRKGLEERYNAEDALAMGMFLNSFIRRADVVKVANLAQLVNVIAPIVTSKNGLFLQTIYWPLVEYGKQRGNQSLDALVTSPTYDYDGRQVGY